MRSTVSTRSTPPFNSRANRKYRGGSRWRYGFEPITRLLIILDVVIMAFLYTASDLQSACVTLWAGVQTPVLAMICPFNR